MTGRQILQNILTNAVDSPNMEGRGHRPLSIERNHPVRFPAPEDKRKGENTMVLEKIKAILSSQFDVDADSITADTDLVDDLGADSLDLVDMLMSLEDEFNIGEVPDEMVEKIRTVGQLVTYIEENM